MQAYAINCANFVRFLFLRQGFLLSGFVYLFYTIANTPRITEQRFRRIKALAGDFGDGAVEVHLAADLVAGIPGVGFAFGRSVLETVRHHIDIIALYPVAGLFHLLALQSIYFLSAADIYLTAMEELLCAR